MMITLFKNNNNVASEQIICTLYFQYMYVVYNNLSRLKYQIASMNKSDFFT